MKKELNAICFQCKKGYASNDTDDIAGDGRCPKCTKLAKQIALKVDAEFAERRKQQVPHKSRLEDLTEKGGNGQMIRARDLGVF